jgi:CheY-like chemotaxis protein
MRWIGRRLGFLLGSLIAIFSGIAGAVAIFEGAFWGFTAALVVAGVSGAFVQQYRFAAADSGGPEMRARAISWVLGPAATLEAAETLLASERPDAALLDANLPGVSSIPLGVRLAADGVPIAFCTGYDRIKDAPPELAKALILTKPIGDAELVAGLKKLLS